MDDIEFVYVEREREKTSWDREERKAAREAFYLTRTIFLSTSSIFRLAIVASLASTSSPQVEFELSATEHQHQTVGITAAL